MAKDRSGVVFLVRAYIGKRGVILERWSREAARLRPADPYLTVHRIKDGRTTVLVLRPPAMRTR